ncbi:MAG: ABC transporter permease [Actinomycetaceae bacterium]|nr:ABC transporter permease [Arcanobacterium sp.]MDD7686443.1 ABC transporter permease [Actinomycetaceae bacterium]MDY5272723.1 ABC transporter permease [Arcanobacterium sp.]
MKRASWVPPLVVAAVLLGAWVVTTAWGIVPAFALPSPHMVLQRLMAGFTGGYLGQALLSTVREASLGCVTAALIGIPLGVAIAHFRLFSAAVEPYLAASQAIPAIAIAPLLVTWVGYGTTAIVVLCTIMVVFPVIVSTAVGIRQISTEVLEAARLDGAGGLTLVRRIEIPLAGPNIMAGLRTGFTLAMTGAVVGEMVIGGERGLGIELVSAQHVNDVPGMFATITLLAVVAVGIYLVLRILENIVLAATQEAA